jgi:manganese-dependent inorganic pyrophosphatase
LAGASRSNRSAREAFTGGESLVECTLRASRKRAPETAAAMETIIIGHRNPDMDSICSAVAYAALKSRLGEKNVRAARAGALNERISFVLEKFGIPQPDFFPDATPRVRDVMITDYLSVHPDRPVAEALATMVTHGLRALPVVDKDRRSLGVISENKLLGLVLPSRERAAQARQVRATLSGIVETIGGQPLTGPPDREDLEYTLLVAAMDVDTFAGRLAKMDPARVVLFVGVREDVLRVAISAGVKAIVVTGGAEPPPEILKAARSRGTAVVVSPHDTATSVIFARGAVVVRHVLENPSGHFDADMNLAAARRAAALSNRFIYPVIDGDGLLEGIVSKSDFLKAPARQLVLVDHNEMSQAVAGASELPIVEILDHHRLGNMPTEGPIFFINKPVGSTCTLVAELYERHGVEPDRAMAGLLMAGIVSDTLNGTSPTTTETDRKFLAALATPAGIGAKELAAEIFAVGSPLLTLTPTQAAGADCKEYEEHGTRFSVSQIEEVTFGSFDERREALLAALRERAASANLLFAALLVTDINKQNSYLLAEGDADFLRTINYPEHSDRVWFLQGVVSRKKQLLPYLTECLAAMR